MLVYFEDPGGDVFFETELPGQLVPTGVDGDAVKARLGSLGDISRLVSQMATSLASGFAAVPGSITRSLDRAELELGVRIDAEGRAFFARGSAGANITLRLVWDFNARQDSD